MAKQPRRKIIGYVVIDTIFKCGTATNSEGSLYAVMKGAAELFDTRRLAQQAIRRSLEYAAWCGYEIRDSDFNIVAVGR